MPDSGRSKPYRRDENVLNPKTYVALAYEEALAHRGQAATVEVRPEKPSRSTIVHRPSIIAPRIVARTAGTTARAQAWFRPPAVR